MISIAIIKEPNSYLSAVYGMKEILEYANIQFKKTFTVNILTGEEYINQNERPDMVVMTPLKMGNDFTVNKRLVLRLIKDHRDGSIIISICGGAFYLCAAGIPAGREVTTHWKLADKLPGFFPGINLREEKILIDNGDYISAGGISSYQDTALYLIKKHISTEAAIGTAKFFLISPRSRTQLQYMMLNLEISQTDSTIARAQQFILENFSKNISLEDIASHCSTTPRTLLRHFKADEAIPPGEYLRLTRFTHAKELLEKTYLPLKTICSECGFSDIPSFSRGFKKLTGLPPGEYRKRNHAID